MAGVLERAMLARHDEAMEAHRAACAALSRLAAHHEETARRLRLVVEAADALAGEGLALSEEARRCVAAAKRAGHAAMRERRL